MLSFIGLCGANANATKVLPCATWAKFTADTPPPLQSHRRNPTAEPFSRIDVDELTFFGKVRDLEGSVPESSLNGATLDVRYS